MICGWSARGKTVRSLSLHPAGHGVRRDSKRQLSQHAKRIMPRQRVDDARPDVSVHLFKWTRAGYGCTACYAHRLVYHADRIARAALSPTSISAARNWFPG
jgi:hypothetical protein